MNRIEFKLSCLNFGNNMIDQCFPNNGQLMNKVVNTTCKYIVKNKINDLDPIINLFADSNGNIDGNDFICYMKEHLIGEGLKINLKDYLNYDIIPDKTLVITQNDLDSFLSAVNS